MTADLKLSTPRTDAAEVEIIPSRNPDYDGPHLWVESDLARTLERETLALAEQVNILTIQLDEKADHFDPKQGPHFVPIRWWNKAACERDALAEQVEQQRGEVETLNLQAAACMTAVFQNTLESAKGRIGRDHPYWTQAYADVCSAVDKQMDERQRADAAESLVAELRARVAEQKWMPIESVPRNHLPVLIYGPYGRVVAFQDVTWQWWPYPAHKPLGYAPTHWQPLPGRPDAALEKE